MLRHATPQVNLPSILSHGIDPDFSGCASGIWFHTKSKTPWAIAHASKRHRTEHVGLIEVSIPPIVAQATAQRLVDVPTRYPDRADSVAGVAKALMSQIQNYEGA